MSKKQVNIVKETAAALKAPAKTRTPRIQTAKHKVASKAETISESPVAQPDLNRSEPAHEAVAAVAYSYWESRGYQGGNALDDWFRAEAELRRTTIH